MKLIQFNTAGCLHEAGITSGQINSLRDPLLRVRDELVGESQRQPQCSLLQLPKQIHQAYESRREESELGRIFQVANGIHDDIDAVVVLGGDSTLSAKALMQACCDPYQNELDRAGRGSKPRMYFAGGQFDNDQLSALLHHIQRGDHGSRIVDSRWALIVIDGESQNDKTMFALSHFVSALEASLGDQGDQLIQRLILPIAGRDTELYHWADRIGCQQVFRIHEEIEAPHRVLSPPTLLPAAMLGLDCMRLLGGAHAITEHFADAGFDDNIVLQLAAINQLHPGGCDLKVWNAALSGFAHWHQSLQADRGFQVTHNVVVEKDRWTTLELPGKRSSEMLFHEFGDNNVRARLAEEIELSNQLHTARGRSTTNVGLPDTDIFTLGQLFQFLMLAECCSRKIHKHS